MDANLIQKLTDLVAVLKGENKTNLVDLGMKALQSFKDGKPADAMTSLLAASKLDSRFTEFLGKGGEAVSQLSGIAQAASGLLGKLG